jgi:hypothetical protein
MSFLETENQHHFVVGYPPALVASPGASYKGRRARGQTNPTNILGGEMGHEIFSQWRRGSHAGY